MSMKSIMEESSTVAKAIDTAWNRAGKPSEFTIKVLELPESGFLGLTTTKSAKIGLFFTEKTSSPQARANVRPPRTISARDEQPRKHDARSEQRAPREQTREQQREPQQRRFDSRGQQPRADRPHYNREQDRREQYNAPRDAENIQYTHQNRGYSEQQPWNEAMANTAQDWVRDALQVMGHGTVSIAAHVSHNYLKIRLSDHIGTDAQQEEMLLKSWGNLAMDSVREKANQPLRHLRVIVESKR